MIAARAHVVVMVTSSFPRFPGDTIGTFVEPIAHGVAARGHQVHVVLPWHPKLERAPQEGAVFFHPYRYAPIPALNVFGYAGALAADVRLRRRAYLAAPLASAAGWLAVRRIARATGATIVHAHWAIPSGAIAAAATSLPLVVSLHGSDMYVAETMSLAARAARFAFARAGWITACSDDLRARAIRLGAPTDRCETVPYGVDAERFAPSDSARAELRSRLGVAAGDPVVFTAGRFVHKKGFEHLVDAAARLLPRWPRLRVIIGGGGDLDDELRGRARALGVAQAVSFPGVLSHTDVAAYLAAADVAVVPSVRDDAGNVDGLPNIVMEALASGTALVASDIAGIPGVVTAGRTGELVPPGDPGALADAIAGLLADADRRGMMGREARAEAIRLHGWARVAERFEQAYERAAAARSHTRV